MNSKSPGISRVLRKRNAKYVSIGKVEELVDRLSFEKDFTPMVWNAVLANKNICIYPKDLSVIVQGATSYTDYVPLNQAASPEDYNAFANMVSHHSSKFYKNTNLQKFEDVWYEDTSKFEKECAKDVILFYVDLTAYDIYPSYDISFFSIFFDCPSNLILYINAFCLNELKEKYGIKTHNCGMELNKLLKNNLVEFSLGFVEVDIAK
jgi:hypothetical protein